MKSSKTQLIQLPVLQEGFSPRFASWKWLPAYHLGSQGFFTNIDIWAPPWISDGTGPRNAQALALSRTPQVAQYTSRWRTTVPQISKQFVRYTPSQLTFWSGLQAPESIKTTSSSIFQAHGQETTCSSIVLCGATSITVGIWAGAGQGEEAAGAEAGSEKQLGSLFFRGLRV